MQRMGFSVFDNHVVASLTFRSCIPALILERVLVFIWDAEGLSLGLTQIVNRLL